MAFITPGTATGELAFRGALAQFATGVTVLTTLGPRGPLGMTVNSFTSVSLDPPLILWCPAHGSARYRAFAGATHYAVNVLAEDQLDLCLRFARTGEDFSGLGQERNPEGAPILPGCLARFDCAATATHDGGDHAILVARVLRAETREGQPLLFWDRRYGGFAPGS
ncbi:MAG: flavin reductase family protein [Rhodobacteraceae bacterium]|nr:flavin reductase family protein [Paracoccaceae bacterium]